MRQLHIWQKREAQSFCSLYALKVVPMYRLFTIINVPLLLSGCIGPAVQLSAYTAGHAAAEAGVQSDHQKAIYLHAKPDRFLIDLVVNPPEATCSQNGEIVPASSSSAKSEPPTLSTKQLTNTITCVTPGYLPTQFAFIGLVERYRLRGDFLNRKIYLYNHVKDAEIWLTPETFPSHAARDEHFAVRRAHASQTNQAVSKVYDRRYGCSEDDSGTVAACSDFNTGRSRVSEINHGSIDEAFRSVEIKSESYPLFGIRYAPQSRKTKRPPA